MAKRSSRYNKSGPLQGGIASYRLDVQAIEFSPREARAEYARLRREANRRLEVLSRSEFKNLPGVTRAAGGFEALPREASESTIRKQLYDVARFLNLRTSSFQGARKARREFVETMQERGYDFINESNAAEFGKFMGAVQKHKEAKGYDSDQIADLFRQAKEKRIDPKTLADDFEFWLEHSEELEEAPRSTRIISSADFADRIGLEIE